jgi:hypothetical protein
MKEHLSLDEVSEVMCRALTDQTPMRRCHFDVAFAQITLSTFTEFAQAWVDEYESDYEMFTNSCSSVRRAIHCCVKGVGREGRDTVHTRSADDRAAILAALYAVGMRRSIDNIINDLMIDTQYDTWNDEQPFEVEVLKLFRYVDGPDAHLEYVHTMYLE